MKLKAIILCLATLLAVSPAGAQLNPDNPYTALYGDYYLGADGNGDPDAYFYGDPIDFDGYLAARPGDTFIIHMFANRMDGWPQASYYRTAFWYDSSFTTRGIERIDWSNTAGTFYDVVQVVNYTGYTMIDRFAGSNYQASIYTGLCIVSWEFTVLDTAPVGSTCMIGCEFRTWDYWGQRQYEFDCSYSALTLEILPPLPPPGDFDNDGDVDVDDIDALCANMTGSGVPLPPGFEQYDLDGDGDADSADMDILIHDLVETTVGIGTEYGDFNLDGTVDTVDLTILGTYFGTGTSWSQGNANCDTTVDTVDLTILATYFGFVAASPIPEPVTMSLLALGGLALIRRRR